jgi:single-strand DNA-binding protein
MPAFPVPAWRRPRPVTLLPGSIRSGAIHDGQVWVRAIVNQPREWTMPQNIAEFRIIGRIGKITPRDKVIYVTVAANYNRRDGDGWKSDPHWNSVVGFSNVREQIEAADKGDLVHITGRMRETSHGEGNEIAYRTELIADTFSVLAKAGGEQ